jgi:cysteinyl-tRNA synthetase
VQTIAGAGGRPSRFLTLFTRRPNAAMNHSVAPILCLLAIAMPTYPADPKPNSMAYVLQADRLAKTQEAAVKTLAGCDRDLIIIDAYYDGPDTPWTADQIKAIRAGKDHRQVVAYFSIGEAENYRAYWHKVWDADKDGKPDAGAPAFLEPVNPDWAGNYKVKFWDPAWQKLLLAELDKIVGQGFDGVYLDIVDAFEYFEYDPKTKEWLDDRKNPATGKTYRRHMVEWVTTIAKRGRTRKPTFLVIPQNGEALIDHDDYLKLIDAIGIEDLFTNGKKAKKPKNVGNRMKYISDAAAAGKFAWVIEYPRNPKIQKLVAKTAVTAGLRCLMTDRPLQSLGQMATSP